MSHAEELRIDPKQIQNSGVHIHVPAGAVPKTALQPESHCGGSKLHPYDDTCEERYRHDRRITLAVWFCL